MNKMVNQRFIFEPVYIQAGSWFVALYFLGMATNSFKVDVYFMIKTEKAFFVIW